MAVLREQAGLRERPRTKPLNSRPSLLKMGLMAGLMSTDLLTTQLAVSASGGNYDTTESDPFMWFPMALSGGVLTAPVIGVTAAKIVAANGLYMYAKNTAFTEKDKPDRLINGASELFANALIAMYGFVTVNNLWVTGAIQGYLPPPPWGGIMHAVGQFEQDHILDPLLQGVLNIWDFFSPEVPAK